MAWNKYFIFVSNQEKTDFEQVLPQLGLGDYQPIETVNLSSTNKPKTLFATNFNGCLILVHPDLVFQFFQKSPTDTETNFVKCFPESEIAVIYSNETVSGFGYAILQNGERIRIKYGSDGEYFFDWGEEQAEEREVFSQPIFDEAELEEMQEEMEDDEIEDLKNFEAGFRVPVALTARYLGKRLDEVDTHAFSFIKFERR